jgi:prepilin-type N-terminal cleavage/methylation domain-containing protein
MSGRKDRGFSLLEMMIVVALLLVVSSITFMSLQPTLKDSRITSAFNLTLMSLRRARERAIDERKIYYVNFTAPQTIQVFRQDGGTPAPPAVLVNTYTLPADIQFRNEPGIPTTAAQTPDSFGIGAFPIDFDINVGGGGGTVVYFKPDGGAYDLAGNINNGVMYMSRPGELYTSRAITMFGLTGRLRGWRLIKNTTTGVNEWKPQ